jgi:hypothetical protein
VTLADWFIQYTTGLVVLGATVNAQAWLQLIIERWRNPDRKRWYKDPYLSVRAGLVLHGPAHALAYGLFGITTLMSGVIPLRPIWFYIGTRILIVTGEVLFVRSAFLFGVRKPAYWMIGLFAVWTAVCVTWGLKV